MGSLNYWQRKMRRRGLLQAGGIAAAGLSAAALVGCGDDDDDDDDDGQPSNGDQTPEPGETATTEPGGAVGAELQGIDYFNGDPGLGETPKRGGKITAMYNGATPHLDPATTTSVMMHAAVTPVYNRLVRNVFYHEAEDVFSSWSPQMTGDLAESWETPTETEYVFTLRDGVKWQNVAPVDGRDFSADDVVYSLERYRSVGLLAPELELVDTIEATDDRTVTVRLKQPNLDFLVSPLGKNQALILPHEIEDADGDFQNRAVGTGPFILSEYDKGVRLGFTANPDYWGKDAAGGQLPYLDEYEVLSGDAQAQQNGFLSGQLDLTFHKLAGNADAEAFKSRASDATIYRWETDVNTYNFAMQLKTPPFNDVRVRRAFNMAIDWNAVNQVVFDGEADDASYFYPWSLVWDDRPTREDLGPWFQYDPEQAKQLLADAGFADGFQCRCEYNEYQPELTQSLQVMQQHLAEVGIQLDIQKVEYTTFFEKWAAKSYESLTIGFVPASAQTMDAWTYGSLLSGSPTNYWDVNDEEIDRLVTEQHNSTDPEERRQLWQQIWQRETDQVWRIPSLQAQSWYYAQPHVRGALTPTRYHNYFHYGGAESAFFWRA